MHRLQKYAIHTASLMLVWFVFCVGVFCSDLLPTGSEYTLQPETSSPMRHQNMKEHGATSHAQHAMHCCEDGDGEHDMANLLSSSGWLLSFLAALAIAIGIQLFPILFRLVSPGYYQRAQAPPQTGYPPVFLTTQRLLN